MQATCDARGRFLDVEIAHPGATSDYLAFVTSELKSKVEKPGFLAKGLVLFGDNAYVSNDYMVTPSSNVSSGNKDDFNFYQSQLRIKIECAFGQLVHRWGMLRKPIPYGISVQKTTSLVYCLCKLHNYCIDEKDGAVAPATATDTLEIAADGGVALVGQSQTPEQLLNGGNHFDDILRRDRVQYQRQSNLEAVSPRDLLHEVVVKKDLGWPSPVPRK